MKTKDVVLLALLSVILFIGQGALSFLPNVELVSLLVIVYTLIFKKKALFIIYAFALLEGLVYGFGIWWITYLYVWTVLYGAVRLFRKNKSLVLWACLSGSFGLSFGALCALVYAVTGGLGAGAAWWIAGIPFDIIHGISNFFVILVLFNPVYHILVRCAGTSP